MSQTKNRSGSTDIHPKQCRICLDDGNADQLISPCLCTGTFAYVHRNCLNHWRSRNINSKGFNYCDICQFRFVIQTVYDDPKAERERLLKYYSYVFRDVTLVILLIQFIVLTLTLLLKLVDRDDFIVESFFQSTDVIFGHYFVAWTLLLALVGFISFVMYLCKSDDSEDTNTPSTVNNYSFTWSSRRRRRSSGDNGNSSDGDKSKSDSKNSFREAVIGIIFTFAIIGFFYGIIHGVKFVKKVSQEHTEKLWLRQEADKYFVRDFHGRRDELQQCQVN